MEKKIEQKRKLNNNINVIHIDLYDTEYIDLMREFLFSILIMKVYGKNEDIFFLSKDIEIRIEIPAESKDFINTYSILNLFHMKEYFIESLPPLIVSKDIKDNIQIVSNYLKVFHEEKIDFIDLYIEGITPKEFLFFDTKVNAEILSQKECQELIFNEIKGKNVLPNYYQIKFFVDILASQFIKFNQNIHLSPYKRKEFKIGSDKINSFIIENFIKTTKYFTIESFTELMQNQKGINMKEHGIYEENKYTKKGIKSLSNDLHRIISFNQKELSFLFFHEGNGQRFSFISNKRSNSPDYIALFNLMNLEHINKTFYSNIPDYNNYTSMEFLYKLKEILDIPNPVENNSSGERKSLEEISGKYIFTVDNFFKMILILLRIRANVPIIMMGETGCGKTSLIRKLSEMINKGENKMIILNIHPGITDKDIINFLKQKVIDEAIKLYEEDKETKKKYDKENQIYVPRKIWVFLDEINTCNSMGLITEIMNKHTYQGNPIPSNIIFIAACNPYRFEKNNLVYNVNPLPHSLLNFVLDFGNLTKEDEKKYIESIILEPIQRLFKNKKENMNEEDFEKIHRFAKKMVSKAQNFIRDKNGISSVSLREIRRFNIFYEFFFNYLEKRREADMNLFDISENNISYKTVNNLSLQIYSIILSVFVSYYLRIRDNKTRNEFRKEMNKILIKFDPFFENHDFLEIPQKEELYIINSLELDKGIAKTRALLDNIFSLFISINNKVPIFIVGMPGYSKSLSVQLINKAMRGNSSNNDFFKQYPKIILNFFQGLKNSTSESILNAFHKAKKI